jgi:hypothetical protein
VMNTDKKAPFQFLQQLAIIGEPVGRVSIRQVELIHIFTGQGRRLSKSRSLRGGHPKKLRFNALYSTGNNGKRRTYTFHGK